MIVKFNERVLNVEEAFETAFERWDIFSEQTITKLIAILVDKRVLSAKEIEELLGNGYEVSDE